jgi:hypothetical protein
MHNSWVFWNGFLRVHLGKFSVYSSATLDTIATFPCALASPCICPLPGNGFSCIRSYACACRYVIYNRPKQGPASEHRRDFSVALDDLSLAEMLPESGQAVGNVPSSEGNMSTDPAEAPLLTPTERPPKQSKADTGEEEVRGEEALQPEKQPEWRCQIDAATGMPSRYACWQGSSLWSTMTCIGTLFGTASWASYDHKYGVLHACISSSSGVPAPRIVRRLKSWAYKYACVASAVLAQCTLVYTCALLLLQYRRKQMPCLVTNRKANTKWSIWPNEKIGIILFGMKKNISKFCHNIPFGGIKEMWWEDASDCMKLAKCLQLASVWERAVSSPHGAMLCQGANW